MVYLEIFTNDKKEMIDFYVNKLGIFSVLGDRLICKLGVELILDLRDADIPSQINLGIRFESLSIIKSLEEFNIPYKLEDNIAGQRLHIIDPNNNKLWITTSSDEIN